MNRLKWVKQWRDKPISSDESKTWDKSGWHHLAWQSVIFLHKHWEYRQTSNISHILVGNKSVDHSDVVWATPTGDAPTTFRLNTWFQWIGQRQLQDETRDVYVLGFGVTYIRCLNIFTTVDRKTFLDPEILPRRPILLKWINLNPSIDM